MSAAPSPLEVIAENLRGISDDLAAMRGTLSTPESAIVPEVRFTDWEALRREQREAINRTIRTEVFDAGITWQQLRADPTRGEVAAKILACWADDWMQAIHSSDYSDGDMLADLLAAMLMHGRNGFGAACALLGQRMVLSAIAHVLDTHDDDAERIAEDARSERRRDFEARR